MMGTGVLRGAALTLAMLGAVSASLGHAAPGDTPVRPAFTGGEIARIRSEVLSGATSCRQVIAQYLARAERLDPELRSLVAIDPGALEKAHALDRLSQEERRSRPLLCAPILVKDNIDVAGLPTTGGSSALAQNRAKTDARVVARVKAAGAIVLGKTNMSEFAFHFRGISSIRGQTRSPFSNAENAGGSSAGNGAALGAGLAVAALGTDTSGSVRVPAALTGTTGLRPTFGALPMDGVMPLSPSQDTVGPMCGDVADCAMVLAVLEGRARRDVPYRSLRGLRIGVLREEFDPHDPSTQVAKAALARLSGAGATVLDVVLHDEAVLTGQVAPEGETARFASRSAFAFAPAMDRYLPTRDLGLADTRELLARLQIHARSGDESPEVVHDVSTFLANWTGRADDPRFRVNGAFRDRYVTERLDEAFGCGSGAPCVDLLVYPTVRTARTEREHVPQTGGTHRFAAYSGRPAIAFPVGTVRTGKGLRPVGLEVLGAKGQDMALLDVAALWERLLPLGHVVDCDVPEQAVCLIAGAAQR